MIHLGRLLSIAALVLTASTPVYAHVTLEQREAVLGSPVKLTFRVPHGCGASPTVKLRVRIPDGVIAVKPMPKPGWQLETTQGAYAKAYDHFHGAKLSQGVREVSWSGTLPDAYYDEFVLSAYVANDFAPGTKIYFPVVQECKEGVARWIEIPAGNQATDDLKEPAPALTVVPRK